MASARKNSSSRKSSSFKRATSLPQAKRSAVVTNEIATEHPRFAICVRNKDYEASLDLRKLYPVLEDEFGSQHGMIRVIDESGEDYLFPNEYFVAVSLPHAVEKRLRRIGRLDRMKRSRLARESAKLDKAEEQALANESYVADVAAPDY